jgi:hypothetical protein
MSSIPDEDDFCMLETKHDRRTAPKPKFFALKGRLQEQRPIRRKTVPGSIPGEDGFFSSETKHARRTAPRPKFFV